MPDALSDFFETPNGATFVRMRDALLADPAYDFHSTDVDELTDLIASEDYAAVGEALPGLMPDWLLSPRAHQLAGLAAERAGNAEGARMERDVARACLKGLLESGDGSPERPFLVTHVADEYDLVRHLGKQPTGQREAVHEGRPCDVVATADGAELWFDSSPGLKPAL